MSALQNERPSFAIPKSHARSTTSRVCCRLKRVVDSSLVVLALPLALLLVASIGLAIKLDSRGPVFYGHRRLGKDGAPFTLWKFRTMERHASEKLDRLLAEDAAAQKEWAQDQKLRNDPRVTRVGRWLRRNSLDELPQLANVLLGQMSLVGPRPIVEDELARYGQRYTLYIQIRPGITGIWQVSGRNDLPYSERVRLDQYYICRWSAWLDMHILCRTVVVVLMRRGAY